MRMLQREPLWVIYLLMVFYLRSVCSLLTVSLYLPEILTAVFLNANSFKHILMQPMLGNESCGNWKSCFWLEDNGSEENSNSILRGFE